MSSVSKDVRLEPEGRRPGRSSHVTQVGRELGKRKEPREVSLNEGGGAAGTLAARNRDLLIAGGFPQRSEL